MKQCATCGEIKPLEDFPKAGSGERKRPHCKPCYNEKQAKYREENPDKIRALWRSAADKYYDTDRRRNKTLRAYGLTEQTYNEMFDAQGGKCAICDRAIKLVVDHCHKTGRVRGLLCNPCNISLGNFEDDSDRLLRAVEYLRME